MNLVELACIRAVKKNSFYSENHSRIFSAIMRFEELYVDELSELMELNEKEVKEILDDLTRRKLIQRKDFKYILIEPFESANSFLFSNQKQ